MTQLPSFSEQLQQLVASRSISSANPEWDSSNREIISLLAGWCEGLGFSIEIENLDELGRKQNLIATLLPDNPDARSSDGLVLSGHSDTVPFDEGRWQSDPFQIKEQEGRAYGLGATDMKGFFALALTTIANSNIRAKDLSAPLTIVATADEECSMSGARQLAQRTRFPGRAVVIGEPTDMHPKIMHKGILMQQISVTGQSGHSSDPELGHNALEAMNQVMNALLGYRSKMQAKYQHAAFSVPVPTMNLGCIHGGDNPNRICAHCELQFDVRPVPGMSISELRDEIDALLVPIATEYGVKIDHRPLFDGVSPFEQSPDADLVRIAETLCSSKAEAVAFATEAPFFKAMQKDVIVLGPGSIDQAHQPNEYMPLSQVKDGMSVYEHLIRHFCC